MGNVNAHKLNPYLRVAMQSVLEKGTHIKQRIIFDYELIYLAKGTFTLTFNGKVYECTEGQFLLLRPNIAHSFDCSKGEISQPHVHFDLFYSEQSVRTPISFKDRAEMSAEELALIREDVLAGVTDSPFVRFSDTGDAVRLLCRTIDLFSANRPIAAKGIFLELLERLLNENFARCLNTEQESTHSVTRQIKDFADACNGVHITLEGLERQFCYSRYYLERQFKRAYGKSLISYCADLKMAYACRLLMQKSVSETAEILEFSSIYSFSRAFKNKYGMSPCAYQRLENVTKA